MIWEREDKEKEVRSKEMNLGNIVKKIYNSQRMLFWRISKWSEYIDHGHPSTSMRASSSTNLEKQHDHLISVDTDLIDINNQLVNVN